MRKVHFLLLSVFPIVLLLASCRKVETSLEGPLPYNKMVDKFFDTHGSTNPMVNAVAGALQKGNLRKEFVTQAVKNAGYPNWAAARTTRSLPTTNHTSSFTGSTEENIVYVPFAQGDRSTDAVMAVRLGATDTA